MAIGLVVGEEMESVESAVASLVAGARLIAERLGSGGRLLARGEGRARADARHIAVEFLHPVIVGKPALPAQIGYAHASPADVVVGVAYGADPLIGRVDVALSEVPAAQAEVQILLPSGSTDAKHAAVVAYHVLWEMAHVFMAPGNTGSSSAGADIDSLYPMLYGDAGDDPVTDAQAGESVRAKLIEAGVTRARAMETNVVGVRRAAEIIAASRSVFTFGNGGSSTDAEDLAFQLGPKAQALSSDMATVTALANDVSFDVVFARPLATLGRPGDAAVGLSTSGTSSNVIAGLRQAGALRVGTIGLAGYRGGDMTGLGLDALLVVASDSVHRIQEAQVALCGAIVDLVATP